MSLHLASSYRYYLNQQICDHESHGMCITIVIVYLFTAPSTALMKQGSKPPTGTIIMKQKHDTGQDDKMRYRVLRNQLNTLKDIRVMETHDSRIPQGLHDLNNRVTIKEIRSTTHMEGMTSLADEF